MLSRVLLCSLAAVVSASCPSQVNNATVLLKRSVESLKTAVEVSVCYDHPSGAQCTQGVSNAFSTLNDCNKALYAAETPCFQVSTACGADVKKADDSMNFAVQDLYSAKQRCSEGHNAPCVNELTRAASVTWTISQSVAKAGTSCFSTPPGHVACRNSIDTVMSALFRAGNATQSLVYPCSQYPSAGQCTGGVERAGHEVTAASNAMATALTDCGNLSGQCTQDINSASSDINTAARAVRDASAACGAAEEAPCAAQLSSIMAGMSTAALTLAKAKHDCL